MTLIRLQSSMRRGLNGLTFAEGRAALRRGVLPSLVHQSLLRSLRPTLVVDVGANRGQFSLDVRCALPGVRVVAFEPLDTEADVYGQIFASTPTHVWHRVALSSTKGQMLLHVAAARDSSSLLPIADRQNELFPGTYEVDTELVEVRTLDDFADEFQADGPSLLKIDVQGAELDVLRGARTCLAAFRWVLLEMSFVELYEGQPLAASVIHELHTRGFELAGTGTPSVSQGRPVQVDALFERRCAASTSE